MPGSTKPRSNAERQAPRLPAGGTWVTRTPPLTRCWEHLLGYVTP
jgi:hypothetical protein